MSHPDASPTPKSPRVVVVGAGVSGLIAAWHAAQGGASVLLLEANAQPGAKLRISGGGKCNLTHDGPVQAVLAAFSKEQARFLRPTLHAFSNEDVRQLMSSLGIETLARENGRVFPLERPESAAAVTEALVGLALRSGVELRTNVRVVGLVGQAPTLEAVRLGNGVFIRGDRFILATGGASYPRTGTRGESLAWLGDLGTPVHPWAPALAPIPLVHPHPEWEGVSLRGGSLELFAGQGGRRVARHHEDIVFTRSGISGPAALALSREVESLRRESDAWLSYALVETPHEALESALLETQKQQPHLLVRTWLQRWMPERLATVAFAMEGMPSSDQRMKDLSRPARKALLGLLTGFPLGKPGRVELAKGEVSAGGVQLSAVDPRTMALKGWDNLRVCGELLDIDGPVGGYNLQAAFSTGFTAGG